MIVPVFCDGELIAFSANTAHHLDIGGAHPGAAIDLYRHVRRGPIFNATFIYREGVRDDNMWHFFTDNNARPARGDGRPVLPDRRRPARRPAAEG